MGGIFRNRVVKEVSATHEYLTYLRLVRVMCLPILAVSNDFNEFLMHRMVSETNFCILKKHK